MAAARRADRARRGALAASVLLVHALLFWHWPRGMQAPRDAPAVVQTPLVVRLVPPAAPPAVAPPHTPMPLERVRDRDAAREPTRSAGREAASRAAAAPTISVIAPDAAAAAPAAPAALSPPATASQPALDLALPRAAEVVPPQRSMRDQVFNDPRSNAAAKTVESRVAAVAGTPRWQEERMDSTRTRWRKDGQCIEVHVARHAQLEPWNQSHLPTPKTVKPECD